MINRIIRPAVVVFVGHVDHGKTTLLDVIRKSELVKHEVGRITQKVGAYCFGYGSKSLIFVDTPGHQAFSLTRDRGIAVADVVVLVVAVDGPVPSDCKDILNKASALKKPIVVGLNKTDKAPHTLNSVTNALQACVPNSKSPNDLRFVPVSAVSGVGVKQLTDAINKAHKSKAVPVNVPAQGVVLDSAVGSRSGVTLTLLVQLGTLGLGDVLVVSGSYARVKALRDETGRTIETADPTIVPTVIGLTTVPAHNDRFLTATNLHKAKEILVGRERFLAKEDDDWQPDVTRLFEDRSWTLGCFLVKAQTTGMLEAVNQLLTEFGKKNGVTLKVVRCGVGGVSKGDVKLASITKAKIIAYGTTSAPGLLKLANHANVHLRHYSLIYDIVMRLEQDLRALRNQNVTSGLVAVAQIKRLFSKSNDECILGCEVTEGVLKENQKAKVYRGPEEITSCEVKVLKRFKDRVAEVKQGEDCGVAVRVKQAIELSVGDILRVQENNPNQNG